MKEDKKEVKINSCRSGSLSRFIYGITGSSNYNNKIKKGIHKIMFEELDNERKGGQISVLETLQYRIQTDRYMKNIEDVKLFIKTELEELRK